jgi:hypothetical protein
VLINLNDTITRLFHSAVQDLRLKEFSLDRENPEFMQQAELVRGLKLAVMLFDALPTIIVEIDKDDAVEMPHNIS